MSTLAIPLDEATSLRLAFTYDVPAALTGVFWSLPVLQSTPL